MWPPPWIGSPIWAGRAYDCLCEALDRLEGPRIRTNIRSGDEEQLDSFGLIDASSIRRKHGLDGRIPWIDIKLSDWVFNAIKTQEVLMLNRDYFRLGKALERRLYELSRKTLRHAAGMDDFNRNAAQETRFTEPAEALPPDGQEHCRP